MTSLHAAAALLLLLTILAGLVRVLRGPTPTDRLMAGQLFGTAGVAILLLLAEILAEPGLRNVALVFALLAVLATVAFVRRAPAAVHEEEERQP
jgi:multicomponent Na+:H+ antiporter subunit F